MNKNKIQGILFIVLAGFFFATMNLFVRLSGDLPTMQKAFFRNAVAALVGIALVLKNEERISIDTRSKVDLFFRCTCGTIGIVCNFYAVDKLGLADANMLNKLSPFFAIVASVFLLKEMADRVEWLCVVIAFTGALFIIKPSFHITSVYGLLGMLGGLMAGIAYTFVRRMGMRGVKGPVIVMCFSLFSSLVVLPFMIAGYKPMTGRQLFLLLMAGVMAAGGQLSITKAYTKAPAKEISVYDYSQVLYAALLGILVLGEFPDLYSVIGYVLIIGVAIYKWRYTLQKE